VDRRRAQCIGAEQNAGDDESGQRRQLEPVENENDQQRAGEDDREIAQDV